MLVLACNTAGGVSWLFRAGSDPPGVKLRAAKALEAVDYFVLGYWPISKLSPPCDTAIGL
jgi:hypothetical protein